MLGGTPRSLGCVECTEEVSEMRKVFVVVVVLTTVLLGVGPTSMEAAGSPPNQSVLLDVRSRVEHQGDPGVGRVRLNIPNLLSTMVVEAGTCIWHGSAALDCRPSLNGQVRFWVVASQEGWFQCSWEEFDQEGTPLRADDLYLHVVKPHQVYLPLVGK